MTRHDLYGPIHKAIRSLLFDAAALVARTDFADLEETRRAREGVQRALTLLHSHAEHEEQAIVPALGRHSPELSTLLLGEHARIQGLEREIAGLLQRLQGAAEAERLSLGLRLHQRLGRLVAEHLVHMDAEEQQANRLLWAHLSDEELREIEGRIVAAIPPAELAEWLLAMLPAMSVPECAPILAGCAAASTPQEFAQLVAPARRALQPGRWERLAEAARLGTAPGART